MRSRAVNAHGDDLARSQAVHLGHRRAPHAAISLGLRVLAMILLYVALGPTHELVTSGPCGLVRGPNLPGNEPAGTRQLSVDSDSVCIGRGCCGRSVATACASRAALGSVIVDELGGVPRKHRVNFVG